MGLRRVFGAQHAAQLAVRHASARCAARSVCGGGGRSHNPRWEHRGVSARRGAAPVGSQLIYCRAPGSSVASRALWWVLKGRALAPPGCSCRRGVSTCRCEEATRELSRTHRDGAEIDYGPQGNARDPTQSTRCWHESDPIHCLTGAEFNLHCSFCCLALWPSALCVRLLQSRTTGAGLTSMKSRPSR